MTLFSTARSGRHLLIFVSTCPAINIIIIREVAKMKKLITLAICAIFTLGVSALSMSSPPNATKASSKEASVKQKATNKKAGKFTSDKNKVKQTRILQDLTKENTLKKGSTPLPAESGDDVHPSGQF